MCRAEQARPSLKIRRASSSNHAQPGTAEADKKSSFFFLFLLYFRIISRHWEKLHSSDQLFYILSYLSFCYRSLQSFSKLRRWSGHLPLFRLDDVATLAGAERPPPPIPHTRPLFILFSTSDPPSAAHARQTAPTAPRHRSAYLSSTDAQVETDPSARRLTPAHVHTRPVYEGRSGRCVWAR